MHLGSADFPLGTRYCNEVRARARTHNSRVRVSHTHGSSRVERAKSVRQVHPTFAGRCRSYVLTYIRLLRGISTSCEL